MYRNKKKRFANTKGSEKERDWSISSSRFNILAGLILNLQLFFGFHPPLDMMILMMSVCGKDQKMTRLWLEHTHIEMNEGCIKIKCIYFLQIKGNIKTNCVLLFEWHTQTLTKREKIMFPHKKFYEWQ
jgi:hypothetical protein